MVGKLLLDHQEIRRNLNVFFFPFKSRYQRRLCWHPSLITSIAINGRNINKKYGNVCFHDTLNWKTSLPYNDRYIFRSFLCNCNTWNNYILHRTRLETFVFLLNLAHQSRICINHCDKHNSKSASILTYLDTFYLVYRKIDPWIQIHT